MIPMIRIPFCSSSRMVAVTSLEDAMIIMAPCTCFTSGLFTGTARISFWLSESYW